uniref:RNA helicase n=1 Tax=Ditylenchus dipsaci TaxID=166011 RepID=A0A915CQU7_9BILA
MLEKTILNQKSALEMESLLHRRASRCWSTIRIALNQTLYSTSSPFSSSQKTSNSTNQTDNHKRRHRSRQARIQPQQPIRLEDVNLSHISRSQLFSESRKVFNPRREVQVAHKLKARIAGTKLKTPRSLAFKPVTRAYSPPVQQFSDELIVPVDTNSTFYHGFGVKQFDSEVPESFVEFVKPVLDQLFLNPIIQELAQDNYLSGRLFEEAANSFRAFCTKQGYFDGELRIIFDDIKEQKHSADLLFPHFLSHARQIFPHIDSMKELKQTSDLTQPHTWFPWARSIHRKIIFHAGPTNSGKTYEALEYLKQAKSGMYCAPLRLLAAEIFRKLNQSGVPCDLVTGEDRQYAQDKKHPANHVSSTVEMLSPKTHKDLAVIDEIQMVRDKERGWAFTRALLAAAAPEVHLCGEEAAIDIVQRILDPIGEHVEIRRYERKSPLTISTHGLTSLSDVQDGDCLVCFSKYSVVSLARKIKRNTGREVAVIYGDMPPAAKKAEADRFNDPEDKCKILVATDAIGMGINLNIARIVFASLRRVRVDQKFIPNYFARQISGRAGRFGLTHQSGYYMALIDSSLNCKNHRILDMLMKEKIENIKKQESLQNGKKLRFCETSQNFFVCLPDDMRNLAEAIQHVSMELKDKWTFCHAPIKTTNPLLAAVSESGPHPAQDCLSPYPCRFSELPEKLIAKFG